MINLDNTTLVYIVGGLIIIFLVYYITSQKETLENTSSNLIKAKIKPWKNCVPWVETEPGKHNDFCQGEFGKEWKHTGRFKGGCSIDEGKGICSRI